MYKNSNELIADSEKEMEMKELANQVSLGSINASGPSGIIKTATEASSILCGIVEKHKLYADIHGKKYVTVEGWTTLGALLGIVPCEVEAKKNENGDWEAIVELVRTKDGQVVGRASAMVGVNERTWKSREEYAKRSMCITRATGKAFRLSFSFIMTLAGYAPTPQEEMPAEIKEIPIIVDRDKIKNGLFYAGKEGGKEGMTKFYQELSVHDKNAYTRKEWPNIINELLEEVAKDSDLTEEIK